MTLWPLGGHMDRSCGHVHPESFTGPLSGPAVTSPVRLTPFCQFFPFQRCRRLTVTMEKQVMFTKEMGSMVLKLQWSTGQCHTLAK